MPPRWPFFVILRILVTVSLLTALGCDSQNRRPRLVVAVPPSPPVPTPTGGTPAPGTVLSGTIDSGGGNTLLGLPMEHYKKDPTQLPEYKKHLASLIARIMGENPILRNRIQYVLAYKSWYFVPLRFEQLPDRITGVSFPTDQTSLQRMDEVWTSLPHYEALGTEHDTKITEAERERLRALSSEERVKRAEEARADHLLHEIVMALYVLKFESSERACLATADRGNHSGSGNVEANVVEMMRFCSRLVGTLEARKPLRLTAEDHAAIRWVAEQWLARRTTLTAAEATDHLVTRGFEFPPLSYRIPLETDSITMAQLETMLGTSRQRGFLPRFAEFDGEGRATQGCRIGVEFVPQGEKRVLKLSVDLVPLPGSQVREGQREFRLEEHYDKETEDIQIHPAALLGWRPELRFIPLEPEWRRIQAADSRFWQASFYFERGEWIGLLLKPQVLVETTLPNNGTATEIEDVNFQLPEFKPIYCAAEPQLPSDVDIVDRVQRGIR